WSQARTLFLAGATSAPPIPDPPPTMKDDPAPLVEVVDATFRYREGRPAILNRATFALHRGERILLEGPSGGGKTTLALVLAGLRRVDSGLVLVQGLDQYSVTEERWRRVVSVAPQFHEN